MQRNCSKFSQAREFCDITKDRVYGQHVGNKYAWRLQIRTTIILFSYIMNRLNTSLSRRISPFIFTHNARIINHDISHNKFKFGNSKVRKGKKLYTLKFNLNKL